MKIIKGRQAGRTASPHQWANDWISVDYPGGGQGIVRPSTVQLDAEEILRFKATYDAHHVGSFWREWTLNEDGTFARRPRETKA